MEDGRWKIEETPDTRGDQKPKIQSHQKATYSMTKQHVLKMVETQSINCLSGKKIKCEIDSVCIHGDNKESLETAKQIKKVLEENNIYLKPLDNLNKFL